MSPRTPPNRKGEARTLEKDNLGSKHGRDPLPQEQALNALNKELNKTSLAERRVGKCKKHSAKKRGSLESGGHKELS